MNRSSPIALALCAGALLFPSSALALDVIRDCPCELRWEGTALGLRAGESVDRIIPRPDGSVSIESKATPSSIARGMGAPSVDRASLAKPGALGPLTISHSEARHFPASETKFSWRPVAEGEWFREIAETGSPAKTETARSETALDPATFPYSALLGAKAGAPFERLWLTKGSPEPVKFVWRSASGGSYVMPDPEQVSSKGKKRDFGALIRADGLPVEIYFRNDMGSAKARLIKAVGRDGRVLYPASDL